MKYATVFLLVLLLYAGCGGKKKNPFEGTWYSIMNNIEYHMVMDKDGSGIMNVGGVSFIFKYRVEEEMIIFEIDGDMLSNRFSFSSGGKELLMINLFGAGSNVKFSRIDL